MYLLYADESGSIGDRKQKHFVLAGFCVFERESYWLSEKIDKVARRINPADPSSLEFHGSYFDEFKRFRAAMERFKETTTS